ncbi:MAG TPA: EboA domain-containing protein [Polyangia bacterium]|nr:EboA domain-containing protein [Polyangia bacterium]
MSAGALIPQLLERIGVKALSGATPWLADVVASLAAGGSPTGAAAVFASMARRLGRSPLPAGPPLATDDDIVSTDTWSVDEAGRVALLLAIAAGSPDRVEEIVNLVYSDGDTREKMAVVRALPLLPAGDRWIELALDAGRTNELPLFAALACENPYPARHYPELEFNKLVMKAVFVGVDVGRIVGLPRRANPELSRMAVEYIEQQLSANRTFPPDLWLAIARYPPAGAIRTISEQEVTRAVAAARLTLEQEPRPGAR